MSEFVTSWSGRKRHRQSAVPQYTVCSVIAVRPGDRYVRHSIRPLTQDIINAMDPCKHCERDFS